MRTLYSMLSRRQVWLTMVTILVQYSAWDFKLKKVWFWCIPKTNELLPNNCHAILTSLMQHGFDRSKIVAAFVNGKLYTANLPACCWREGVAVLCGVGCGLGCGLDWGFGTFLGGSDLFGGSGFGFGGNIGSALGLYRGGSVLLGSFWVLCLVSASGDLPSSVARIRCSTGVLI